jgi:hypothetical protein
VARHAWQALARRVETGEGWMQMFDIATRVLDRQQHLTSA